MYVSKTENSEKKILNDFLISIFLDLIIWS
jgi:hypothetical protein